MNARPDENELIPEREAETPPAAPLRRVEERGNVLKGAPEALPADPRALRSAAGAFTAIGDDLDRRSREWVKMARLLDQNRQYLDAAIAERDAAYAELAETVPVVQQTARDLDAAIEACRAGQPHGDIDALFRRNGDALDHLESVAEVLSARFLWCRSAWEQYTRSVEWAQRLRAETQGNTPA